MLQFIQSSILRRFIIATLLSAVAEARAMPATAQAASSPQESVADQLQQLPSAQQSALDSGDPSRILATSRQLGSLAMRLLGDSYLQQGQPTRASDMYQSSLSVLDSFDTRLALALSFIANAKADRALEECAKLTAAHPEDPRTWNVTGQAHLLKNNAHAAAEAFARSWALAPDIQTGMLLIMSYAREGHSMDAGNIAEQVSRSAGNSAGLHLMLANAYHLGDDLGGAISEASQATALDTHFAPAHLALGTAFWELNEYQYNSDTLREFSAAQALSPKDYFSNLNLGSILSQYQRYSEATPYLQLAATAEPVSPDPWFQLGMNAYAQDQQVNAREALERCIALTGSDRARNNYQIRQAYAALSRINTGEGRDRDAKQLSELAEQTRAQMLSSHVPSTLTESTGIVVSSPSVTRPQINDLPSQRSAIPVTLEQHHLEQQLQALIAKSLNDAGTVLARGHDYTAALPLFRQASIADPGLPLEMRNLGLAAFHTGAYQEAITALSHTLELDPNDALARTYLDQANAKLNASPHPPAKE